MYEVPITAMQPTRTEGRQAWLVRSHTERGGDLVRTVEDLDGLGHVLVGAPDDVEAKTMPREAKRGLVIALCADEEDDDTLRAICERLPNTPVLAVGLGRGPRWASIAVARGAHAVVDSTEDGRDARGLTLGIEQAFALAQRVRGHHRIVGELHASVQELSRRIDHLGSELARLEVMAWTDSLTGLANRRQLEQRLPQVFAEAARYERDVSCMMIDLDGFKMVNDELGHAAGDELLRIAARTIVENTRASDICSRYGGDEFVVLMPETNAPMAGAVATRLKDSFCEEAKAVINAIGPGAVCLAHCSMSIGVSCRSTSHPKDADELLAHADSALYGAKRSGKSAVMIKTAGGGVVGLTG